MVFTDFQFLEHRICINKISVPFTCPLSVTVGHYITYSVLRRTLYGLLNRKTYFKHPSILRPEMINMVIVVYADANTFTKKGNFLFF